MADVLDQSEVDALLSSVATGGAPEVKEERTVFGRSGVRRESAEVKDYDFKRPERVSKDQMRALQTLHDAFARNFGASLSGFLRTIIEVKVATCEQMTYSEFIASLPNPTAFNLLSADGLEGQMCLEVSPLIIYPIIDRLLGGSSIDLFIPQRPMTLIEMRLISNLTVRALQALTESWAGVKQLKFKIDATESNPQLVQIVPPNEVVVVVGFELKMSNRAGTMNLCIPFTVIEPVMDELSSQSWFSAARNQKSKQLEKELGAALAKAGVLVTGVLAETTITLRNLTEMQPGDVIVTEKGADRPVVLSVEGQKKFAAQIGQFKGSRALKILNEIRESDRL